MVLPIGCPRCVELLAGICWTESQKYPLFPRVWGGVGEEALLNVRERNKSETGVF